MSNNSKTTKKKSTRVDYRSDYLFAMSHAPSIDESASILHMIPIVIFSSVVIMIVRMFSYHRPMSQFYWISSTDTSDISDFFSYYKMEFIIISAVIALLMLLFRVTTQSLTIKRTKLYIPMLVYSFFIILSYIFCEYKEFSLLGYNDRFEGTIPLLCYMVMLFLVINSVNTEKNVKQIIIPIGIMSVMLGILGLTQGLDHDFFRTGLGQKLIVPNLLYTDGTTTWGMIDEAVAKGEDFLRFTFTNKQIYQTVYNINYVSFYLTLLVPLFGMLFIRSFDKESKNPIWKTILLGIVMAILIYNLIGSASSGGYLGLGVAVIVAIVLFNKQLLKWIKPLLILLVICGLVMAYTTDKWLPEITGAVKTTLGIKSEAVVEEEEQAPQASGAGSKRPYIDYINTEGPNVTMSFNGEPLVFHADLSGDVINEVRLFDKDDNPVQTMQQEGDSYIFEINDTRFYDYATMILGYDGSMYYLQVKTPGTDWNFTPVNGEMLYYHTSSHKTVKLEPVETWGFEDNYGFGSGRGGIWAHTFPMMKDTIFIGHGADTYCLYYPQNDYAGRYNEGEGSNLYLIVDKPHNMYMHMAVGTGMISLLAVLALYGIYLVQSFKLFWKREFGTDFLCYAGVGIFLGCLGFMVTGLVDDSTVSVMPLFYTLLGTGIAINMIIKRRDSKLAQ